MKTHVSKDLCIGCELCAEIAPELYIMEDDGKAKAVKDDLQPEDSDLANEAADGCPTDAISVE